MGRIRHSFWLAAIAVFVGCGSSPVPDARTRAAEQIGMHEVVFRDLFDRNGSTLQLQAEAYYLSVHKRDAGRTLLARFEENDPPVRPDSMCDATRFGAVVDRETGKRGIRFAVLETLWKSADRAKVKAGWLESDRSIGLYMYFMERDDQGWAVDSRGQLRVP